MKKVATIALLLVSSHAVSAQPHARLEVAEREQVQSTLPIDHVTDELNQREDARRALASFHEARRQGILPAAKTAEVYEVGETREFLVHANDVDGSTREPKTFELKGQSAVANVWVEVGELSNGNVQDTVLADLEAALLTATPEGSYNASQGIIANNNQVFGNPPNVDGDASPIVDVLLYNIPDQNQGSVLAGFVWSGDLCTTANAGTRGCSVDFSNQADVLYLDTNPLLDQSRYPVETLLEVAAHEYQHLIHFAYDENEETFVNEGLSEWAERLNGYRARTISYLSNEAERNISLFTWRDESADVLKDYQRAGLFTTYLAERLGPELAGSITKREDTGATGYRAVLEGEGMTLEDVLVDFHTANLLNDLAIGGSGHYGYANPYLQSIQGPVSPARLVDGRTTSNTPPSSVTVNGGGSIYLKWENVTDFSLTIDLASASPLDFGRARSRAILEEAGGVVRVEEVTVGGTPTIFEGEFDAITIITSHVKPVSSGAIGVSVDKITYEYSAAWGGGQQIESELVQYDQGQVNGTFGFYILDSEGNGVLANRFEVPGPDAILGRVYMSPYFISQFADTGLPPEAPRDVELRIWADDGTGRPGAQIYATPVIDDRDYPAVLQNEYEIRFFSVDLSKNNLPELPAVIHVGYAETGSDANYMVMGFANYTTENVSFIGGINGDAITWKPLWEHEYSSSSGELISFSGKALPIRAEFLTGVTVDAEEDVELPGQIALDQNYPNPFNPATSISFTLPRAQQVRLAVYDVTGRMVASLVDQTMTSGEHTALFDGSGFASGVYVYVLRTEDRQMARKMLLVK